VAAAKTALTVRAASDSIAVMAKGKRWTTLKRQLRLLRWMMLYGATWVDSYEIRSLYGPPMKSATRRLAERDLRALQTAGVPLEWSPGYWRLPKAALAKWRGGIK
jgi:hypothetical protein